jgi:hypothetical protein
MYAATGIVAVLVIAFATYYWTDREGSRNLERCMRIRPGVMVADLRRQLTGGEFYRYDGREAWVSFTTPRLASTPIQARYDSISGRILELNCSNEDGPLWKTDR